MAIVLYETRDVYDAVFDAAEEIFDGWFADRGPIDWERFWDRLEAWGFVIEDMASPAAQKIQRHVRGLNKT